MSAEWSRREFSLALGAVSAAAAQRRARAASGSEGSAAGLLTEIVYLDDCVRLAMCDSKLPAKLKSALTAYPHHVRNGPISPSDPAAICDLLSRDESAAAALSAGRLFYESLAPERKDAGANARLHQDAALLSDLARSAGRNTGRASAGEARDLFETLHTRSMLALHTLNPDRDDIHGWLEGLFDWKRNLDAYYRALAEAYAGSASASDDFYEPSDGLTRIAREFQFGRIAAPVDLEPALRSAKRRSGYARALAGSIERLRTACG